MMDIRVGVDVKFPTRGSARPEAIHNNGVTRKIKFSKCKCITYQAVLEDGKQVLLFWDMGTGEWYIKEGDSSRLTEDRLRTI